MSKQINITRSEFQLSWKNHYSLYKRTNSVVSPRTRRLLLFYSVECGCDLLEYLSQRAVISEVFCDGVG